jgi:hypothetical protein
MCCSKASKYQGCFLVIPLYHIIPILQRNIQFSLVIVASDQCVVHHRTWLHFSRGQHFVEHLSCVLDTATLAPPRDHRGIVRVDATAFPHLAHDLKSRLDAAAPAAPALRLRRVPAPPEPSRRHAHVPPPAAPARDAAPTLRPRAPRQRPPPARAAAPAPPEPQPAPAPALLRRTRCSLAPQPPAAWSRAGSRTCACSRCALACACAPPSRSRCASACLHARLRRLPAREEAPGRRRSCSRAEGGRKERSTRMEPPLLMPSGGDKGGETEEKENWNSPKDLCVNLENYRDLSVK